MEADVKERKTGACCCAQEEHAQEEGAACCRHKERSPEEYKDLTSRLNRIEGQIRGIKGMLDKDAYCLDILTQVAAATSALNSFSKVLLANHIRTCVEDDVKSGSEEKIDELIRFLPKLMK